MFETFVIVTIAALVGLIVVTAAILRAWTGWLALKERELDRLPGTVRSERGSTEGRHGSSWRTE